MSGGYLYVRDDGELWVMHPGHEGPLLTVDSRRAERAAIEILDKLVRRNDRLPDK